MQTQQVRGVATKIERGDTYIAVTYHRTQVAMKQFRSDGPIITLNSGGYHTMTTKNRMNQFSHEFCGGKFSVFQKDRNWFVRTPEGTVEFEDNMQFKL